MMDAKPLAWFEVDRARSAHVNAMIRAMDASAAVGAAQQRLEAARHEVKAATAELIFAKEHEAAVLPLVASTWADLQRIMETDD